jgi:hypothetical protein
VQERAERAVDERRRLVKHEVTHVPLAQIELDADLGGTNTGLFEHCRGSVDTDHRSSDRLRNRNGYASVPDSQLDYRPIRRPCQSQIEIDVGRHLG